MTVRLVCAWCGWELSPGEEPATHGLCEHCEPLPELELEALHKRLREAADAAECLSACSQERPTLVVLEGLEAATRRLRSIGAELLRRARASAREAHRARAAGRP